MTLIMTIGIGLINIKFKKKEKIFGKRFETDMFPVYNSYLTLNIEVLLSIQSPTETNPCLRDFLLIVRFLRA